jgi:hypothetical protein
VISEWGGDSPDGEGRVLWGAGAIIQHEPYRNCCDGG